jgi:hypothetical protein
MSMFSKIKNKRQGRVDPLDILREFTTENKSIKFKEKENYLYFD